jgi:hypothetical protein
LPDSAAQKTGFCLSLVVSLLRKLLEHGSQTMLLPEACDWKSHGFARTSPIPIGIEVFAFGLLNLFQDLH